jgi:hypothetical protein
MNPTAIGGHLVRVLCQWTITIVVAWVVGRLGKKIGQDKAGSDLRDAQPPRGYKGRCLHRLDRDDPGSIGCRDRCLGRRRDEQRDGSLPAPRQSTWSDRGHSVGLVVLTCRPMTSDSGLHRTVEAARVRRMGVCENKAPVGRGVGCQGDPAREGEVRACLNHVVDAGSALD